jgi:pilus assembly protein CpaB
MTRPSGRSVAASGSPEAREAILVAAHPIATGLLLRTEDMRWKEVAASDVSPAYLARGQAIETDYVGAVCRRDFAEGEPLVAAALVKRQDRGFLAAVLTPGMRAVTITVSAPQSAAGLLLPGDHIDIILTQRFSDATTGPAHQVAGETVLSNIRIIAVDQKLSATQNAPSDQLARVKASTPGTITLEVSSQDAQKLLVAAELGNVGVAVRPLEGAGASQASDVTTVWAADVSPALAAFGHVPSSSGSPESGQWSTAPVQVIHGAKVEIQ